MATHSTGFRGPAPRYQRERVRPTAACPVALLRMPATRRSWMRTTASPRAARACCPSRHRTRPARSQPTSRPRAWQTLTKEYGHRVSSDRNQFSALRNWRSAEPAGRHQVALIVADRFLEDREHQALFGTQRRVAPHPGVELRWKDHLRGQRDAEGLRRALGGRGGDRGRGGAVEHSGSPSRSRASPVQGLVRGLSPPPPNRCPCSVALQYLFKTGSLETRERPRPVRGGPRRPPGSAGAWLRR